MSKAYCILQELQILLAPDKEHKKVFSEVPIVGFRNGKSLKDYPVRTKLPKMDNAGGSEPRGKGTCQVCDHGNNNQRNENGKKSFNKSNNSYLFH